MKAFKNTEGYPILLNMVKTIQENKDYLGEIDGAVGDGDHGANMNKGFSLFQKRFKNETFNFTDGLFNLGAILLNEIGGSMGPIYGTIFITMSEMCDGKEEIGAGDFAEMLTAARKELFTIVEARPGDKTLVDAFSPAVDVFHEAVETGKNFQTALADMCNASEEGKESTRNMTAKYGRASCLGERSRGVLDAGAVSCDLLLHAMAEGILNLLERD